MPTRIGFTLTAFLLAAALCIMAAERQTDPTFLHRFVPDVKEQPSDFTTATCHYKPILGAGDPDARSLRGIARYGAGRRQRYNCRNRVAHLERHQVGSRYAARSRDPHSRGSCGGEIVRQNGRRQLGAAHKGGYAAINAST